MKNVNFISSNLLLLSILFYFFQKIYLFCFRFDRLFVFVFCFVSLSVRIFQKKNGNICEFSIFFLNLTLPPFFKNFISCFLKKLQKPVRQNNIHELAHSSRWQQYADKSTDLLIIHLYGN